MESIKKQFYKLAESDFNSLIKSIKENQKTIILFSHTETPYYYLPNREIDKLLLVLHQKINELDYLYSQYSDFLKEKIKQNCLIEEIHSTNKTENVYSTHHDIFGLINHVDSIKNRKVASIINTYLLMEENDSISSNLEIRKIYDKMMKNSFDTSLDKPDGKFYRTGKVDVSDGANVVHQGFNPENKIIDAMEEFLTIYHCEEMDLYERLILSHFMLETIHPFYDGNGRLGRLLFSKECFSNTNSLFSYNISKSINDHKSNYYKALSDARDIHEFGILNKYMEEMLSILIEGANRLVLDLKEKNNALKNELMKNHNSFTKSEKRIYDFILTASYYSIFGITNNEIMEELKISKRTVISTMNKLKELELLQDTKVGKLTYHKIKKDL